MLKYSYGNKEHEMKARRNLRKPCKMTILYNWRAERREGNRCEGEGEGWGCSHSGFRKFLRLGGMHLLRGMRTSTLCTLVLRLSFSFVFLWPHCEIGYWLEEVARNFLRIRSVRNLWLNDASQMNMDFGICQRGSIWVETIRTKILEFLWSLQFHIYS